MKPLVIDASVAIKWFIPEEDSIAAVRFLTGKRPMLAPDLIRPEVGNILWKLHRRRLLTSEDACQIMADFLSVPIEIYDNQSLMNSALEIAVQTGRTVYDSVYLALAVKTGGTMVTADLRLVNALAHTAWASFIRPIQ